VAHLARVVEYDVPDREGNGSGELIVLLTTILDARRRPGRRTRRLLQPAVGAGEGSFPDGTLSRRTYSRARAYGHNCLPLVHPAGRGMCWFRGSLVEEPQQLVVHRLVMA